jgi:hypothetical protein
MSKESLSTTLDHVRQMLTAAKNDEQIKSQLAAVGFDAAMLQEGQDLYDACIRARDAAHEARLRKRHAADAVTEALHHVDNRYRALAHVARTLWSEQPAMLDRLGLRERRRAVPVETLPTGADEMLPATRLVRKVSKTQAAFVDRARILYTGTLENQAIRGELAKYGYAADRLTMEREALEALEQLIVAHERSKVSSKEHTAALYTALELMNRWIARFSGIAQAALMDWPNLLLHMGLKPRLRRR